MQPSISGVLTQYDLTNLVIDNSLLDGAARLVGIIIARRYYQKKKYCYISIAELSEKARCSRSTVKVALQALVDSGEWKIVKGGRFGMQNQANRYYPNLELLRSRAAAYTVSSRPGYEEEAEEDETPVFVNVEPETAPDVQSPTVEVEGAHRGTQKASEPVPVESIAVEMPEPVSNKLERGQRAPRMIVREMVELLEPSSPKEAAILTLLEKEGKSARLHTALVNLLRTSTTPAEHIVAHVRARAANEQPKYGLTTWVNNFCQVDPKTLPMRPSTTADVAPTKAFSTYGANPTKDEGVPQTKTEQVNHTWDTPDWITR